MAHAGPSQPPRRVYLDLGVNYGDTLDLFRQGLADEVHRNATNWEVYGFEPAPLLQPYLERLMNWKNGEPGAELPITCVPPAGSTKDRIRFASAVGCYRTWAPKVNFCLDKVFNPALDHLRPDTALLNRSFVQHRLDMARTGPRTLLVGGARYTYIPAAVSSRSGELTFTRSKVFPAKGTATKLPAGSTAHMASRAGSTGAVNVAVVGESYSIPAM